MLIREAKPPVAVASTTTPVIPAGGTVTLDGSESYVGNQAATKIVSYEWTFENKTSQDTFTVTSSTPVLAQPLPASGEYTVTLIVTDDLGLVGGGMSTNHLDIMVVEVTFDPEQVALVAGSVAQVEAYISPEAAVPLVKFRIVDDKIAGLNAAQLTAAQQQLDVSGIAEGSTLLEASVLGSPCGSAQIDVSDLMVSFDKDTLGTAPRAATTLVAVTTPADSANKVTFEIKDAGIASVNPANGRTGSDSITVTGSRVGQTKLYAKVNGMIKAEADVIVLPLSVRGRPVFSNESTSSAKYAYVIVDLDSSIGHFTKDVWSARPGTARRQTGGFSDPDTGLQRFNGTACQVGITPSGDNSIGDDIVLSLDYTVIVGSDQFSGLMKFDITAVQIAFANSDLTANWFVNEFRQRSSRFKTGGWPVYSSSWTTDSNYVKQIGQPVLNENVSDANSLVTLQSVAPTPLNVNPIAFRATLLGQNLDGQSAISVGISDSDLPTYKIEGPTLNGPHPNPVVAYPGEAKDFSVGANPIPALNQLAIKPTTAPITVIGINGNNIDLSVNAKMNDVDVASDEVKATLSYDLAIPHTPTAALPLLVKLRPLAKVTIKGPKNVTFLISKQDAVAFKGAATAQDAHPFPNAKFSWTAAGAGGAIGNDGKLTVLRPGQVSVFASSLRAQNVEIQSAPVIKSNVVNLPVFDLSASLTVTGAGKRGRDLMAQRGTTLKLIPQAMAGPNDVTKEAIIVKWNTPTGSNTFIMPQHGAITVSARVRVRGVEVNTPAYLIRPAPNTVPPGTKPPAPGLTASDWVASISSGKLSLGPDTLPLPPIFKNLHISLVLGTIKFRNVNTNEVKIAWLYSQQSGYSSNDIISSLLQALKKSDLTAYFKVFKLFYDAFKNVPFSAESPVWTTDGSSGPNSASAFLGVWQVGKIDIAIGTVAPKTWKVDAMVKDKYVIDHRGKLIPSLHHGVSYGLLRVFLPSDLFDF